jgi:hypothetical protein
MPQSLEREPEMSYSSLNIIEEIIRYKLRLNQDIVCRAVRDLKFIKRIFQKKFNE